MAKVILAPISGLLTNPTTAANSINNNFTLISTAFENTLSRDGTTPNQMGADIDMNTNDLLNVGLVSTQNLTTNGLIVNGIDIAVSVASAAASAAAADASRIAAASSASSASSSASSASTSASNASTSETNAAASAVAANVAKITWRGPWVTSTGYVLRDAVQDGGSSYIVKLAHTSSAITEPGVGASWATYWDLMASAGANGTGTGDVVGPASATANRIAIFSGTTGKLIADGGFVISSLAPVISPPLTGTPTAPTASAGTSTTQIATTAFVTTADNLKAPLASPALTGTPTAPTASAGTNNTQIATTAYADAAVAANGGVPSSTIVFTIKSAAPAGWLMFNDGTIGDASSGAGYANALSVNVFTDLYNNASDLWCPVLTSAGAGTTRAALGTAAAAYAAHARITLPITLGRALAAAGAGASLTSRALAVNLGEENHLLTVPEMPSHAHTFGATSSIAGGSGSLNNAIAGTAGNTSSVGGGGTHNNMQPTVFLNVMIKL